MWLWQRAECRECPVVLGGLQSCLCLSRSPPEHGSPSYHFLVTLLMDCSLFKLTRVHFVISGAENLKIIVKQIKQVVIAEDVHPYRKG